MKILITGASGFLGWHLVQELAVDYQVVGTHWYNQYPHNLVQWERINLMEIESILPFVQRIQPQAIIHLAAIANVQFCETYPALTHQFNIFTTTALAQAAAKLQIPMIFTSTDLVFSGNDAPYDESSFAHPLSRYGQQKLDAEESLLEDFSNTFVVRLPLLFGWGASHSKHFFRTWHESLSENKTIPAFMDEYRTPLSGECAAAWLRKLLDWILKHRTQSSLLEQARLLHLGGNETISRYDFAVQMCQIFQLNDKNIIPTLRSEIPNGQLRPADTSLSNDLACQLLAYQPPSLKEQLLQLKQQIG